jgi:hypothetical protein
LVAFDWSDNAKLSAARGLFTESNATATNVQAGHFPGQNFEASSQNAFQAHFPQHPQVFTPAYPPQPSAFPVTFPLQPQPYAQASFAHFPISAPMQPHYNDAQLEHMRQLEYARQVELARQVEHARQTEIARQAELARQAEARRKMEEEKKEAYRREMMQKYAVQMEGEKQRREAELKKKLEDDYRTELEEKFALCAVRAVRCALCALC